MQQLDTASRTNDLVAQQAARVARDMHSESIGLQELMETTIVLVHGRGVDATSSQPDMEEKRGNFKNSGGGRSYTFEDPSAGQPPSTAREGTGPHPFAEETGAKVNRVNGKRRLTRIKSLDADSEDFKKAS
jgi:hypothetical protein